MEDIIDQPLFKSDKPGATFGSFGQRLGATILDTLILAPVSFGLTYLNITTWKSSVILIIITLAGIAYKPIMEAVYGATLGKMIVNLKVTNLQFETASTGEILLRNVFHIAPSLITLVFNIQVFNDPGFASVSGFGEYSVFIQRIPVLQYISWATSLITIIDAIVLLADQQRRSLHDKIAGTVVIVSPK